MIAKIGPVKLPDEMVKFSEGVCEIREKFKKLIFESEVPVLPEKWSQNGQDVLVHEVRPLVNPVIAREVFNELLRLLSALKPERALEINRFSEISESDFMNLIYSILKGDRQNVPDILKRLECSTEVAEFALLHTVGPFMQVFAKASKKYNLTENWAHSFCPVCGSKAYIARLDKGNNKRYLHCHFCDTEWQYKLLSCTWCGNDDHRSLAFVVIEETPGYGLHVCEQCKGYIKVIDERNGGNPDFLNGSAATLYLDIVAQQKGYYFDTATA